MAADGTAPARSKRRPILCATCETGAPACECVAAAERGRALSPLLALPLCPCDDGACMAPVLAEPGRIGRLYCLAGHAWHEPGRQGDPAPMWSAADAQLRAWARRDRGAVRLVAGRWVLVLRGEGGRWKKGEAA